MFRAGADGIVHFDRHATMEARRALMMSVREHGTKQAAEALELASILLDGWMTAFVSL